MATAEELRNEYRRNAGRYAQMGIKEADFVAKCQNQPLLSAAQTSYQREYQQQSSTLLAMGVTEEQYIHSRMVDEGLALITASPTRNVSNETLEPAELIFTPDDARYLVEYEKAESTLQGMGVSKEAYVASRRTDDGLKI